MSWLSRGDKLMEDMDDYRAHLPAEVAERVITNRELESHKSDGDMWMVLKGIVFEVSNFRHPGGARCIHNYHNSPDLTEMFQRYRHSPRAGVIIRRYAIGVTEGFSQVRTPSSSAKRGSHASKQQDSLGLLDVHPSPLHQTATSSIASIDEDEDE